MYNNRLSLLAAAGNTTALRTKYPDPTVALSSAPTRVVFHPSGNAVLFSFNSSPGMLAYGWSSSGFSSNSFTPSSPNNLTALSRALFTVNGSHVIVISQDILYAYEWSSSTGFGTRQQSSYVPSGSPVGIGIVPSGNYIVVTGIKTDDTPFADFIPWTGTAFSTPVVSATIPSGLTGGGYNTPAFTVDGTYMAVGSSNFAGVVYPLTNGLPGTPFTGGPIGPFIAFSPSGTVHVTGRTTAPQLTARMWSGAGFGSSLATTPSLGTAAVRSLSFSPANNLFALSTSDITNPLLLYRWTNNSFGDLVAFEAVQRPGSLGNQPSAISFSPTGNAVISCHASAPFVFAYDLSSIIQ